LNIYRVCHSMTGRIEPCEAGPLGPTQSKLGLVCLGKDLKCEVG
jgi:hypothetical protein